MIGIILASHGEFANGIRQSGEMIFGEQEKLETAVLLPSMGPDDLRAELEEKIKKLDCQEILFLVDLWGGTPFNQVSALMDGHEENWAVLTGLNLPMLIEALGSRLMEEKSHDLAKALLEPAKEGVKTKPESLMDDYNKSNQKEDVKENIPKISGSIPEGTVIGSGKINIVLARIDTRLLHGQVATGWTKATNPSRIIVVSDNVSEDELRKSMIREAAPPGVKAHVVPVWKMAEIFKDPRFGDTRAMLLFETPQDALALIELGVDLDEINLGSMAHSQGKAYVTSTVSMGKEDVETFEKLLDKGVKIDVRKVPANQPENFKNIMKKAKSELGLA
ncbi:PTS sugar transporter subunit IIB [Anaerococcus hydrogenalis]|uniref:PTS system mannose-specific EIIAB component n=1 Tax=Anaerococcus hydrogenalis TaxID=33029 RepID=A0A2N6UHR1_9FIRM|nr:PTS sugar transporter subunit IIB [Anaerococcus hydrogenalis]MBS5989258.1 PTS sugar transporter subunit IIB [Anaerococcus hydrogenalis]MDK7695450.1 PTS sugar transporter subunit IIB [Anaerococcus hydrogenalis]MDK7697320.1 PTS sugar transporter subunit IIB [Anaerococcus hydrogenalis]MDK7708477.1 PTS sugar transporter subunit IIB [Anaerococcus hydrogenalis]PMC81089.1 PTS mannose transporter subunit IIAB [Anaerococcus hydrogenalis]